MAAVVMMSSAVAAPRMGLSLGQKSGLRSSFASSASASFAPVRKVSVRFSRPRGIVRMEAEFEGSPSVGEGEKGSMGSTAVGAGTAPLSGTVTSAGIAQKGTPVSERMAYVCNDCGYIYDQETPFEEVDPDTYKCPVCSAPKSRYTMANLTVGEAKESNQDVSS